MRIADSAVISSDYFDTVVVFSVKINLDRMFENKTEFELWEWNQKKKRKLMKAILKI